MFCSVRQKEIAQRGSIVGTTIIENLPLHPQFLKEVCILIRAAQSFVKLSHGWLFLCRHLFQSHGKTTSWPSNLLLKIMRESDIAFWVDIWKSWGNENLRVCVRTCPRILNTGLKRRPLVRLRKCSVPLSVILTIQFVDLTVTKRTCCAELQHCFAV